MFKYLACCFMLVLIYPLGVDLYLVGLPDIAKDLNATAVDLHTAYFSIWMCLFIIMVRFIKPEYTN